MKTQLKYLSMAIGLTVGLASSQAAVLFRLPLATDTTTHYWYDHTSGSGISDWRCGGETYDGHRGSDFSGGPRGKPIYAAHSGMLGYKIDGFGDGFVGSTDGGGFGNHVRLDHAENFTTWYGHMSIGSVTTKAVGSSIACSEQLGGVGTSGSSSGLHLHFEPRISGVGDDPYTGACGGPLCYWVNQNGGSPTTQCQGTGSTVIVDNSDAGFSVTGTWATGSSSTDKYGADYRYHSTQATSAPAQWVGNLPASGNYSVYVWYPQGANRSPTAPYIIYYNGGNVTKNVNQQSGGGQWNLQGTWNFNAGNNTIKLSCWTGTGFNVMADAVKWVQQ